MGTDILFCRIVEVVMDVIIRNQDQTGLRRIREVVETQSNLRWEGGGWYCHPIPGLIIRICENFVYVGFAYSL